jgi:hypothetical protein
MWRLSEKRPRTMRKKFVIIGACLLVLVVFLYQPIRTLGSIQKIGDYPLYVMEYHGDYDFLSRMGIIEKFHQNTKMGTVHPGTSTSFAALNPEGYALFGHNLDVWNHNRPTSLLLFTDPPDGFASVAMVSLDVLGYENDMIPWHHRLRLFLSPYMIQDGMNEYGLAVAVTSSPCRIGATNPHKPLVDSSQAMRLLLDHAKTVDEAIVLLQDFNIHFPRMCGHHHLADAHGNTAIVEYVDGEAIITRGQDPWLVVTNFLIAEVQPEGANGPCWRYMQAYEKLSQHHGQISPRTAMQLLEDVSTSTIWSIVYNLSTGKVDLAMGRDYKLLYTFDLEMETNFQPRFETMQALLMTHPEDTNQP